MHIYKDIGSMVDIISTCVKMYPCITYLDLKIVNVCPPPPIIHDAQLNCFLSDQYLILPPCLKRRPHVTTSQYCQAQVTVEILCETGVTTRHGD